MSAAVSTLEALRADLSGPGWLAARRRQAVERWQRDGFPAPKAEAWRFTPVKLLTDAAGRLEPGSLPARLASPLPDGVDSWTLDGAPDEVARGLGRVLEGASDRSLAFPDVNTALFDQALVVRVRAGTVLDRPVEVEFGVPEGAAERLWLPRLLVVVEEGAQASLIESYRGPDGLAYSTNAVTEVALAPGAILEHARVQAESAQALHVGALAVRAERDATWTSHVVSLGGRLGRLDPGQ